MNRRPTLFISGAIILLFLSIAATLWIINRTQTPETTYEQWKYLSEELVRLQRNIPDRVILYNEMLRSHEYRSLASEGKYSNFISMIDQDQYFWVKLAGFYAIQANYPDKAFECALRLLLTAERPVFISFIPVITYVKHADNSPKNRDTLDIIGKMPHTRIDNRELVIQWLPSQMLLDWFNEKHATLGESTVKLVVTQLYRDAFFGKIRPTAVMAMYLNRFWSHPGRLRLMYIICADPKQDRYLNRLREYLSDESVVDAELELVVTHRKDVIKDSIDIDALKASAKRCAMIRKLLGQDSNDEPAQKDR